MKFEILLLWNFFQSTVFARQLMQVDSPCSGVSIMNGFVSEPSDFIYHDNELWAVSDNGRLASMDSNGILNRKIKIEGAPDLEGIAIIPDIKDKIYLGQEYPPAVLEFDLVSETVVRSFDLAQQLIDPKSNRDESDQGLESLLYFQNKGGEFMLVGRQHDAKVFTYLIKRTKGSIELIFKSSFIPPGPQHDLSAMAMRNDVVYFLYDKEYEITTISKDSLYNAPPTMTIKDSFYGIFNTNARGMEGLAFSEQYVFIAIDAPHKRGRKDMVRFKVYDFFNCFAPPEFSTYKF